MKKILNKVFINNESRSLAARLRVGGNGILRSGVGKEHKNSVGVLMMFFMLIMTMISIMYHIKSSQIRLYSETWFMSFSTQ